MYGVESSTYAPEMVYASSYLVSPPAPPPDASELTQDNVCSNGYATTAMDSLTETLNASGFVHIAGGVQVNFSMLVSDRPDESVDMEDLKPGIMEELVSWVASKLEGSPQTAQDAQARINPKRAVSLLR